VKPAFRLFIDAFAAQLGKSTAQGLIAVMAMLALSILR
jgi:hypothetical protein